MRWRFDFLFIIIIILHILISKILRINCIYSLFFIFIFKYTLFFKILKNECHFSKANNLARDGNEFTSPERKFAEFCPIRKLECVLNLPNLTCILHNGPDLKEKIKGKPQATEDH